MTDDAETVLNEHANMLSHELRMDVDVKQAVLDLKDKARRHEHLRGALKRPRDSVRRADNGNVVIDDCHGDGTPLIVLTPETAARLASHLTLASHDAPGVVYRPLRQHDGVPTDDALDKLDALRDDVDVDDPAAYVVDAGGPTLHDVADKHDDVLTAECGDSRNVLGGRMCRVLSDDDLPDAFDSVERVCPECWPVIPKRGDE